MKTLNYKELIAYASSFVSFILPYIDVEEIILFGSIARGEATKESDIDLFFNLKNKREKITEKIIKTKLKKFYKSKIAETWQFKGIKNTIGIKVGDLDKWKLKRSIISDGIVLYGKYKAMPEKTKGFVYFNIKPIKDITKRNYIIRKLFGRKEKSYKNKGIIENFKGKKLTALSFIIPLEKSKSIVDLLSKEKIDFSFFEFWTDEIV